VVYELNPGTARIVHTVRIGGTHYTGLVAAAGAIWTFRDDTKTLVKIDPGSHRVVGTKRTGVSLTGLTQLGSALWALESERGALVQIDPGTMELGKTVRLRSTVGQDIAGPTAAGGALWVAGQGVIARVDPGSGRVDQRIRVSGQPGSLAVDHDTVFFVDPNATALRRVPVAGGRTQTAAYAAPQPGLLALIDARVYVTDDKFPSVIAIDPGSRKRLGKVVLRRGPPPNNQMADGIALTGIAAAGDALWLPDWDANKVYRVPVSRMGV
jgi:hypothetical protein